ncbi:DNA-binding response regulator [Gordonibacter sp. An230]|uniref:response regulator transcription factor n=1 Tax=Gordonibacter sp. An230 TaxID=1965592 RepID=UPI000B393416|nr:response regulator transcription factor [Gordonibacter sp. An230]OUO90759.1 DNA-binding response regulator [Gordonibacter sp. An230]
MARIFVVEDDASLRDELLRLLELQGHEALSCSSFDRVVEDAVAADADCVILDLKLPGSDGHAVCRDLRRESDVPIVMLTSSDSEFDEVMSMNLGADDYVTKPYRPAVLLARVQSALRRAGRSEGARIACKGVSFDMARGTVEHEGRAVELTRNEQKILHLLMANHGVIISRQELMVELWQSDAFIDDNTLTVNINRLRKSLASIGVPGDFLVTRRGQGYLV